MAVENVLQAVMIVVSRASTAVCAHVISTVFFIFEEAAEDVPSANAGSAEEASAVTAIAEAARRVRERVIRVGEKG